jgi:ParB/RepB/Spo0J family partition protein
MKIQQIEVSLLKPFEKNAKVHPKEQVDKIKRSILEFGFNQPIVVDKNYEIVVGHGRLLAALELGMSQVPVLILEELNENQIKAYRLADNKLNESPWDMALVVEELQELKSEDYDFTVTGFCEVDLNIFKPLEENQNDRLDEKKQKECPECGAMF